MPPREEVAILDVVIPSASLDFHEADGILAVVIPEAFLELDEAFNMIQADCVMDNYLNSQVSAPYQHDVVYASDTYEVDDALPKARSKPQSEQQVSASISLTLNRASTYRRSMRVEPTLPIVSCLSSANTCKALVSYKPVFNVNSPVVDSALTLDRLSSTLTFSESFTTTPITVTLQSSAATFSMSAKCTALVLYRPPIHLDVAFMYQLAWSRLLAVASSETEQFWQGVATDLCTRVYRERVALDLLALLHRGVGDVPTSSGNSVETFNVVSNETAAEEPYYEHAALAEAEKTNHIVSEGSEVHKAGPVIATGDLQASFGNPSDHSRKVSLDTSPSSPTVQEDIDDSYITDKSSTQCSSTEDSSNEAILKIIDEKQQLEAALQHQKAVSSSLRTQLVDREEELDATNEKLRDAERRCGMYDEESIDTSQQVRNLQQQLAVTKRQLDEKNRAQPFALQTPQAGHAAAGFNIAAITAARDQAQKEAQHNLTQYRFVEEMLNEVIADRDLWKHEAEELRHEGNEVNEPLIALNTLLRDNVSGLEGQVEQLKQLKEAADARVKVVESYNKNLLSEYTIKHAQDPQEHHFPGICKPNEVQDLRQALEASMHNHGKTNDANVQLQDMIKDKDKEIVKLLSDRKLIKDKAARYASYFETLKGRVQSFMHAFPATVERRLGVDVQDIEGFEEKLQVYEARELESIELLQEADEKLSALERELVTEQRRYESQIEDFTTNVAELRTRNIELEGLNFQSEERLMTQESEIMSLKEVVKNSREMEGEWRVVAEDNAYGKHASTIRAIQEAELGRLRDEVEAVQWKAYELSSALEQSQGDDWYCRMYFARMMEGVRRLGYLNDWHRQQVKAFRERFQAELVARPLNVAYKPDWSDMPEEQQRLLAEADNEVILRLTGIDMGLGLDNDSQPKELSVGDLWSGFYDECERRTGFNARV